MILTDEQFEKLYLLCKNKWVGEQYRKRNWNITDTIFEHPECGYKSFINDSRNIEVIVNRHNDYFFTYISDYTKDFLTPFPPSSILIENGNDFAKRIFCELDKKVKECFKEKENRITDLLK